MKTGSDLIRRRLTREQYMLAIAPLHTAGVAAIADFPLRRVRVLGPAVMGGLNLVLMLSPKFDKLDPLKG